MNTKVKALTEKQIERQFLGFGVKMAKLSMMLYKLELNCAKSSYINIYDVEVDRKENIAVIFYYYGNKPKSATIFYSDVDDAMKYYISSDELRLTYSYNEYLFLVRFARKADQNLRRSKTFW